MSIVIEVDGVRVEAETEKEARKLLARAVKARVQEKVEERRRYNTAMDRAQAGAYGILCRRVEGLEALRSWRLHFAEEGRAGFVREVEGSRHGGAARKHWLTIQGATDGGAVLDHYGQTFAGASVNGGGWVWCVGLRNDWDGAVRFYSVGECEGVLALAELPGVTAEYFDAAKD